MRHMEHIDGLLGLIDREFAEMEQNGKFRSRDEVELAYKMMDIVKDASEYCEKEMGLEDDYSEYYPMTGRYSMGNGMNYARGSMRRNSMGQFSREGSSYRNSYEPTYNSGRSLGYSRTDAKQEYIDQLYKMMDSAPDEQTRQHIQRMIQDMER